MHAWVFRHRHGLRSVYGLPPEPRLAGLIARARTSSAPTHGSERDRNGDRQPAAGRSNVRQLTIRPHPRRA